MRRLVLIDGKSVFYRGYYAMPHLSLSDGTPTGGVYGFAAIAMEIVGRLSPTKVVVAWDSKSSVSQRRALYADYKAGRVKPGDDFYAQIPLLEELIHALGWEFIEVDKYEADDIIGTLAREADAAGDYETFIISSDLDMLQIVDENTHMWRILKGFTNIEQIDIPELEAKYGIKSSQFLDLKALKGDASDNIPGVPGIGEKTAAKLLNEYGSLDGIYNNIDSISGSTRTKLESGKDSAYLSQKLARIMFDAPVELAKIPEFEFNKERIIAGLEKLEFNSLIRKIEKAGNEAPESPGHILIKTVRDNGSGMSDENLGRGREEARLDGDMSGLSGSMAAQFPTPTIIDWDVKSLMHKSESIATEILEQNATFWDLGQADFLLNPLKRTAPDLLQTSEESYALQLASLQRSPRLFKVYTELDLPLIPVLFKMERKGMLIDRTYFSYLQKEYEKEVGTLEQNIHALAGQEFNVNSPVQLSEILFEKLGLPVKGIKKTTKGYSTGAKELEKLKDAHPVIPELIKYREAAKLLGTYITPIPSLTDENNRIHTTFTQNVTATGRLSSKDPNLQNIPVRTDAGKRIRTGFIAPEGCMLVSADYSQFELRLAAALAGDDALIEDFNNNVDIHTKTASEAFGIPMGEVTKLQRRAAKVINFGVLYGMSVKGLSDAAGMPMDEAKRFIDNYFRLRAPIKRKLDEYLQDADEKGYVETYFGRRRPTPDVKSPNFVIREAARRAAQNMPIQGTEADLMKRAMIEVDRKLKEVSGAELVMQVHDSLIVECPEVSAGKIAEILQTTMENIAPELPIKLAVEVTTGKNWGEL
ncbi:DNA polymerase I [Candidatus Saccharibacteria bacterium]|nr:DNA polymerase I [Candidatus Saccharibacteria bacterium]